MAQSAGKCYCSVPLCKARKKRQPYLSFHEFPVEKHSRSLWLRAIRRDEGPSFRILRASALVCSLHFQADDLYTSPKGRRLVRKGAVPSKFAWNNYKATSGQSVCERASLGVREEDEEILKTRDSEEASGTPEHGYAASPQPGPADEEDEENERLQELRLQAQELQLQLSKMTLLQKQPKCKRFCASDSDFQFYTRFPSEEVFLVFWESVQPSASRLVYWSRAQSMVLGPSLPQKLLLIDECFLFFCCIAAGLKEKVLASIFDISLSTVNSVIITWANYLFQVLGVKPVWITQAQVQATMPDAFSRHCPNVRVIVDITEVHCEAPSSLSLQSETLCKSKNTKTFKGLIGIAPCGVITFVSKLYPGSISDKELTMRSGLLQLLCDGDEVVAGKEFVFKERLAKAHTDLTISSFKSASPRSSAADAPEIQATARLRELVQRAIRQVKEYHIWDSVVPLSLTRTVNQLWAVCCLLTHYHGPLDITKDKPV